MKWTFVGQNFAISAGAWQVHPRQETKVSHDAVWQESPHSRRMSCQLQRVRGEHGGMQGIKQELCLGPSTEASRMPGHWGPFPHTPTWPHGGTPGGGNAILYLDVWGRVFDKHYEKGMCPSTAWHVHIVIKGLCKSVKGLTFGLGSSPHSPSVSISQNLFLSLLQPTLIEGISFRLTNGR